MKIKPAIMLSLYVFLVSPASGNYSGMNAELEGYTPPGYYTHALEFPVIKFEPTPESSAQQGAISSSANLLNRITALKTWAEQETDQGRDLSFLTNSDEKTRGRLTQVSQDRKKVSQMISRNIILGEIEVISALRNPAVLAAQEKVRAESASFDQVMDLDENLSQYAAFTKGLNNNVGPLKMKGSIKQKFPFPGLTSLKSRVVLEQVAVLTERLKIVQKETITKTRQAYWNLVFIEQSIGITSETVDALIRLRGVATALYTSGATSFQDILKINIKLELLKEDLATLLSQKKTIEAGLCELLNLSAGTALGKLVFSDPLKKIPEPEVLFPLARQNRQELSLIRHRIARVQTMIEMTESMVHEPFSLGFSRFEDEAILSVGTGSDKSSFPEKSMASMKNSSPLNSWYGIDYPWLNQTKLNLLSLKQTFVEAENATDRMVREAWFSVDKNRRELDTYQNRISALSKSAVDVTTREYEAGSIPFPQVIDAYTSWLRVNLTIAKRKADLGSSIATLEQMIGISF